MRERPPLADDALVAALAAGWGVAAAAVDRSERLGRAVAAASPRLVLCHGDLHLANLLVDGGGRLAVVDWDGVSLAPRERDLCFLAEDGRRFLEGYGGRPPWTR
jgi:spectinomycin phosphotransferase